MQTMQGSLNALYEQRQELFDEVEAIQNLAEKEKRELTDDEQVRLDAILDEKTGEITAIQNRIEKAEKRDREMKRIAALRRQSRSDEEIRTQAEGELTDSSTSSEPRIYHKMARLKAFPNTPEGAKDAYHVGMWMRAIKARCDKDLIRDESAEDILKSRGWEPRAAQTEGTDTAGGYLTPQPLSSTIIDIREQVGIARRICDIVPMSSKTEDIPKRTGGLTVYYPGEANTVTASDMAFGQVNLVAIKRAVANQISSELSDDALVNMTDRAVNEMGYALALKEDDELINGDGTSTYGKETGLLNAIGSAGVSTAVTGHDLWTELDTDDVANWLGKLPSKYYRTGQMAIVCSMNFYWLVLHRLQIEAGGNATADIRNFGLGELADASFYGIPIFFTDRMPTASAASTVSALYGNFVLSSMLGDRTGVRMSMSMDYAFLDDVNTLLSTSRYDINVHEPGDSSNAGGFVGFKTAA